jgi:multicomponent Na+:H+ antiporter subunit E
MRLISLTVVLFLFWLALSGHYTPFLLAAGAGSAILCVVVAARLRIADGEGHPAHLAGGALTYVPWLLWEIAKSGWAVTKLILHPRLPISPTMTKVMASQKTTVGIATYANSITLTPGTITTGVKGSVLTVHALVREGAAAACAVLVALALAVVRALKGPTVFDRVLAGNSVGTLAILLLAVVGFLTGRPEWLDIAITYGLLNVISTLAILKFFRHGDLAYDAEEETS